MRESERESEVEGGGGGRGRETSRRPWKGASRSDVLREAPCRDYKCERAGENHLSAEWEAKKPTADLLYVYMSVRVCVRNSLDESEARVYTVGSQVVVILTRKEQERWSSPVRRDAARRGTVRRGENSGRNRNNFDRSSCSLPPSDLPQVHLRSVVALVDRDIAVL